MSSIARLPSHFVHLMLGLGAIVVLLAYAILDIRRNGWQTFARKLSSKGPSEEEAPTSTKPKG